MASTAVAHDRRAYKKEHYRKNRDRILAKQKEFYYAHHTEIRASRKPYNKKYREGHRDEARIYRKAHRQQNKHRSLVRKFQITLEQYNDLLIYQNNLCACCGELETAIDHRTGRIIDLAVDHDHNTGRVRELLCYRCNSVIGLIKESHEINVCVGLYLHKHKEVN